METDKQLVFSAQPQWVFELAELPPVWSLTAHRWLAPFRSLRGRNPDLRVQTTGGKMPSSIKALRIATR